MSFITSLTHKWANTKIKIIPNRIIFSFLLRFCRAYHAISLEVFLILNFQRIVLIIIQLKPRVLILLSLQVTFINTKRTPPYFLGRFFIWPLSWYLKYSKLFYSSSIWKTRKIRHFLVDFDLFTIKTCFIMSNIFLFLILCWFLETFLT